MRKLAKQDLGLVVYRATLSCTRASKEESSTRDRERVPQRPKDRVGSLCPFCHYGYQISEMLALPARVIVPLLHVPDESSASVFLRNKASFTLQKKVNPINSTTFVLFGKYCPIVDQLGSKDSSRDF